jgi:hypothetical protein
MAGGGLAEGAFAHDLVCLPPVISADVLNLEEKVGRIKSKVRKKCFEGTFFCSS